MVDPNNYPQAQTNPPGLATGPGYSQAQFDPSAKNLHQQGGPGMVDFRLVARQQIERRQHQLAAAQWLIRKIDEDFPEAADVPPGVSELCAKLLGQLINDR